MKSGSFATKVIMAVLCTGVIAYFGIQGYRYLAHSQKTVATYSYETEEFLTLDGMFVRDETVLGCEETLLEPTHEEGERVAAGGTIATVFASAEALARSREVETLETQLAHLQYALGASGDMESTLLLDTDIVTRLLEMRAALTSDSFFTLDRAGTELKYAVLRREFAYSGAQELDARVSGLKEQIAALSAGAASGRHVITAPFAGTYSAGVDGYESVLTPALLGKMTPSAFAAVEPEDVGRNAGKLIRGDDWYYVCVVSEEEAEEIAACRTLTLHTTSGTDIDLPVTVSEQSKPEDGRVLLTLHGRRYLSEVTLLRRSRARLALHSYSGLRIPKNALRIDEQGRTGVYCLVGLVAYFKPVELVYQGEDYCLVKPGEIGSTVLSTIELYTLRAADQVIISTQKLYNGKVVGLL